eukprot:TRINITY_DN31882_c0_g1_i1.p2 TRINITY_DN31882_c0_g1~~TRINITY_DN31882_c0_g1_i1.p2  ORF type:complete len:188 (+),score=17.12 TRINITY_DN31882_c0_g1_i1:162-725(+)
MTTKCITFELDGRAQYVRISFSMWSKVLDVHHGFIEDASSEGVSVFEGCTTSGPLICCCGKMYKFEQDGHCFELWIMDSLLFWLFVDGKAAAEDFRIDRDAYLRRETRTHLCLGFLMFALGVAITVITSVFMPNYFVVAFGLLVYGGTRIVIGCCMLCCMRKAAIPGNPSLELNSVRDVRQQLLNTV